MTSALLPPNSAVFLRFSWCRYLPCVVSALSSLPLCVSSRPSAPELSSPSPVPHIFLFDLSSQNIPSKSAFISSVKKQRYHHCRRQSECFPRSESRYDSKFLDSLEQSNGQFSKVAASSSSSSSSSSLFSSETSATMNSESSHGNIRNSNSNLNSSNSNESSKPHPPLIDVDCNLLHPDLISVLNDSYLSTPEFQSRFPSELESETKFPLTILHHPSTASANIAAVISPSSTIDESERNVRLLESVQALDREKDCFRLAQGQEREVEAERNDIIERRKPLRLTNGIEIKTTVGVHPYHTESSGPPDEENLTRLRALLSKTRDNSNNRTHDNDNNNNNSSSNSSNKKNKIIACIGETGLDYSPGFPSKEHQLPWFQAQLDLAWEYNLPLFLHERAAFEDAIRCIDEADERHRHRHGGDDNNRNRNSNTPKGDHAPKIIIHCFTGNYHECLEYIQRGYHISLSGYVLKPGNAEDPISNHDAVRKCLRDGIIPWNKLMIETDAPYMGFESCRETFYEAERRWCEEEGKESPFGKLKAKKKKNLMKGIYPNVPGALSKVLEGVWEEINAGRRERGEEEVSLAELARITTENAVRFFGLEGVDLSVDADSVHSEDQPGVYR